jgi:hypothetical protein
MIPHLLAPSLLLAAGAATAGAQTTPTPPSAAVHTRADTLRGSIGPARAWWHVEFYELHVAISPADSSIRGRNGITYRVIQTPRAPRAMQIDLMVPLEPARTTTSATRTAARRAR